MVGPGSGRARDGCTPTFICRRGTVGILIEFAGGTG